MKVSRSNIFGVDVLFCGGLSFPKWTTIGALSCLILARHMTFDRRLNFMRPHTHNASSVKEKFRRHLFWRPFASPPALREMVGTSKHQRLVDRSEEWRTNKNLHALNGDKMTMQDLNRWKFTVKYFRSQYYYTCALLKTLVLRCCSKWVEQLSSRISKYLANGGFSSGPELVHGLWNDDGRSAYQLGGHRQLSFIQSAISLRHRSKFRHICRETLHRGSLCQQQLVCSLFSNNADFPICVRLTSLVYCAWCSLSFFSAK